MKHRYTWYIWTRNRRKQKNNTGSVLITLIIYGLFGYLLFGLFDISLNKIVSQDMLALTVKNMAGSNVGMVGYITEKDKKLMSAVQSDVSNVMLKILATPTVEYNDKNTPKNIADDKDIDFFLDNTELVNFNDEMTGNIVEADIADLKDWTSQEVSLYGGSTDFSLNRLNEIANDNLDSSLKNTDHQSSNDGNGNNESNNNGSNGNSSNGNHSGDNSGSSNNENSNNDNNGNNSSSNNTGNSSDNAQNNGSNNSNNDSSGQNGSSTTGNVPAINLNKVRDINVSELTYEYLMKNFYTVVSSTTLNPDDIEASKLMNIDMKLKTNNDKPQILIYHTHGQEGFTDSVSGDPNTGIIGVGNYLVQLLQEYGYNVIHITDSFDYVNGVFDRSKAYDYAYEKIAKVLAENPSVEVVIDLHRDGVGEHTHLVTEVNGKQTAQIMFFNGISRLNSIGEIGYLYNPYRTENLAMSLQMKVLAEEYFPGFTRRNYIQAYQYNLHMRPKSMLIEAGAQTNSFEEVKNAMEPLAAILHMCIGEA